MSEEKEGLEEGKWQLEILVKVIALWRAGISLFSSRRCRFSSAWLWKNIFQAGRAVEEYIKFSEITRYGGGKYYFCPDNGVLDKKNLKSIRLRTVLTEQPVKLSWANQQPPLLFPHMVDFSPCQHMSSAKTKIALQEQRVKAPWYYASITHFVQNGHL